MQWILSAMDRPGSADVRREVRAAHLEWIAGWEDRVVRGGPYLSDDGEAMLGSLILVDFPDRESVEKWAAEDPYAKAGLFESVTITAWKKTVGAD